MFKNAQFFIPKYYQTFVFTNIPTFGSDDPVGKVELTMDLTVCTDLEFDHLGCFWSELMVLLLWWRVRKLRPILRVACKVCLVFLHFQSLLNDLYFFILFISISTQRKCAYWNLNGCDDDVKVKDFVNPKYESVRFSVFTMRR